MFFDQVLQGAPDVMYHLKVDADADTSPEKVDLGVGIYRNEAGVYHELKAVKEAKEHLAATNPNHDYELTTGNDAFLKCAAKVVFGKDTPVLISSRVASVQTISGTGAVHLGFMFLGHSVPGMKTTVHLGTPAWGNYQPMAKIAGLEVKTYSHYRAETGEVDWESTLEAVRGASPGSIFILQACCHNPTAADFTKDQWRTLAQEIKARHLLPLFDIAYQGLGNGLDEDMFSVRHFVDLGIEMLVCQSFSKNFGLYGERVGALHVVCSSAEASAAVRDQLRFLIRSEFSSAPAYGARIVTTVLSDPVREADWHEELNGLHERLHQLRARLFHLLTEVHKTPGDWNVLIRGTGLFSLLPLSPAQCITLQKQYHIYLVPSGRITIPGLNRRNLAYVAESIDCVVRSSGKSRI